MDNPSRNPCVVKRWLVMMVVVVLCQCRLIAYEFFFYPSSRHSFSLVCFCSMQAWSFVCACPSHADVRCVFIGLVVSLDVSLCINKNAPYDKKPINIVIIFLDMVVIQPCVTISYILYVSMAIVVGEKNTMYTKDD